MKKENGTVLLLTLIVMSILIVGCLALATSTQTATIIAGNIAFKDAASAAGDIGIDLASTALLSINPEVAVPNQYYPTQQPVDSNGIPTTVDWSVIPTTTFQNYNVQFVIDRLCAGTVPIANITNQCTMATGSSQTSQKIGGTSFTIPTMYYRVTSKVIGPKNSTSYIQSILRL